MNEMIQHQFLRLYSVQWCDDDIGDLPHAANVLIIDTFLFSMVPSVFEIQMCINSIHIVPTYTNGSTTNKMP